MKSIEILPDDCDRSTSASLSHLLQQYQKQHFSPKTTSNSDLQQYDIKKLKIPA
jgi:hypothetical protein